MPAFVWFRADLRTADNTALYHACRDSDDGVVGAFIICPNQWLEHDWAKVKVDLILRTLQELSESLDAINIPLKILTVPRFGDVPDALLKLAKETNCKSLYFNKEYAWNEARRDEAVTDAFKDADLTVMSFTDQVLAEPGEVLTQAGDAYSVFTPFKKALLAQLADTGLPPVLRTPREQPKVDTNPDKIPSEIEHFTESDPGITRPDLWQAGEDHAKHRLEAFIRARVENYKDNRDTPSINGTSTLSPYLAIGCLSPRQCLHPAYRADDQTLDTKGKRRTGPATWISELIWREFYKHFIVAFPRVCKHRAFRPEYDEVPWRDDDESFEAWCEGKTGIPIVDAAMRQLNTTGWMHNRCRMIAAMFLSKNLLIDWRKGERYFMRNLVDGDLGQNNGGWQWSSSSGADAAPYFRIFNPVSQSKKHDPDGAYIRKFVPELEDVEGGAIHEPWELPELLRSQLDYPEPIVDHSETRKRAIEVYKEAVGNKQ